MATKQQWTIYHFFVFTLTFFSYAFFHATRKTFSNVKQTLMEEWTSSDLGSNHTFLDKKIFQDRHFFDNLDDAEIFLGVLDSIFLFSYAIGLYISGVVGDRLNLRKVLSFGMCSSALMVFMFGSVSKWIGVYNKAYYIVFWFLNGVLQSTGWPCTVAIMGNWFGKSSRGFVFGLWSSCASVGNIIGAFMVSSVLDYGYEYAFFVPSVTLFAAGIVNYFCLLVTPAEMGLAPSDEFVPNRVRRDSYDEDEPILPTPESSEKSEQQTARAIGFCEAFLLPGVIPYALSYAFLKLVNYSFFFWLPLYLDQEFGWTDTFSDKLSTFYDVGGIVSGTIAGFITDRLDSRAPTVLVMLFLAVPLLYVYSETGSNRTTNAAVMTATGVMIGGPANLISSAISADLGRQNALHDNSEALATVTGIIDGTGSVGAAIGQVLIPLIKTSFVKYGGWKIVFIFLMIMTFLSFLCIIIGILSRKYSEWRQRSSLVYQGTVITPSVEEHFTSSMPVNSESPDITTPGAV